MGPPFYDQPRYALPDTLIQLIFQNPVDCDQWQCANPESHGGDGVKLVILAGE
jgi:hypothetical protein